MLELIVKLPAIRTGRRRIQKLTVVSENLRVVQIEIVIAQHAVLAERIVKCGVQMIALSAELHDVPRVQIAIPVGTVAVADGDHTRQAKPVAQELDRLGHALADTDAVGQRADDLVRIRFFKLIVANVFHNEIMDRALLLRRWQAAQRTQ